MRTLALLLAAGAVAFSQTAPPDTVAVTVSRTIQLPPAIATYEVTVLATNLDDALAAVAPLGLGPADLTSTYTFRYRVPYGTKVPDIRGVFYSLTALDPDPQSLSDTKFNGDLTLAARLRAQSIATAAGKTLGRIVSIVDVPVIVPRIVLRAGDFSTISGPGVIPILRLAPPVFVNLQVTYALTVRFAWQ